MLIEILNCWWLFITRCYFWLAFSRRKTKSCVYNLTIYYQSTHFISFPLSALTHSISLPCKIDGKEGQSIDADFWHPVESISHQHRCSKFLMKSRIIWSNYDHDQKLRLHLVACNQNQRFAFPVISCCISRHFMLHLTSFHVTFHTFHCTHYIHRTHVMHIAHFAFHEQRAFHTLHHTSRHFMCHFISFSHEISYYTHSYHLGVKREENRSKRHTLQLSTCQVRRSNQEDKNATWVRHFYKR